MPGGLRNQLDLHGAAPSGYGHPAALKPTNRPARMYEARGDLAVLHMRHHPVMDDGTHILVQPFKREGLVASQPGRRGPATQ